MKKVKITNPNSLSKKKVILLINTSFHPNIGGVENTLKNLALELSLDNKKVLIVAGDKSDLGYERLKSEEYLFGAKVIRYKYSLFPLYALNCMLLLNRIKRKYDIDIVISRSNITTICCKILGIKNIKYVPSSVSSILNKPSFNSVLTIKSIVSYLNNSFIEYINLKSLKKIYVFSDEIKRQALKVNGDLSVIKIFPGLDHSRFRRPINCIERMEIRNKLRLPLDKNIILYLGRIEKVKNIEAMIGALNLLDSSYILLLVGDGLYKSFLVNHVNLIGVNNRVIFLGPTSTPELYYQCSDLFFMTSFYESFGQTTLEALNCGLKVYGFKNGEGIQVATEEIFQMTGVKEPEKYLCDAKDGYEGLAKIIKDNHSNDIMQISFKRSWSDFFNDLIRF